MADKPMSHRVRRIDRELRESTTTIDENKVEVNRRLQERFSARYPDKQPPDFILIQDWIKDEMNDRAQPVYGCDEIYGDARNTATLLSRRSKEAHEEYEAQSRFERNGVKVNCGDDALYAVGMATEPPGDRYLALAHGQGIVRLTGKPEVVAGIEPLEGRPEVDFEKVNGRLKPVVKKLDTALTKQKKQQKEVESAKSRLDDEVGNFRGDYGDLVGIEKGLMNLAGMNAIAERLRPKKKKASGSADTTETQVDPPQSDTPPPADPPADSPADPPADSDGAAASA